MFYKSLTRTRVIIKGFVHYVTHDAPFPLAYSRPPLYIRSEKVEEIETQKQD